MSDFAIECTLCDLTFNSEDSYSNHKCSAEENINLLPIKEELMDEYEEEDCQMQEIKNDIKEEEIESTTIEIDPLAILDNEVELNDEPEAFENLLPKEDTSETSSILSKCLNKYNCKLCGEAFIKKDKFTKHFRLEHKSYRPYECKVCKKKFLHKHYVTLHMRVHTGEKPYECTLCPKAYSHKTSFTIHMRIHNGERPYVCSVCGKKCYDKSGLTSHMRSHTKETPYQCEVCGRRFTHSKSLLVHRRNHTGEKPYSCSYCGKAFRHWHKHKIHVRLHTGERPYKCKICNKGFPRNDEVSRHMKSHTGIKSFKCSICSVYCATQASITGHINLHHENLKIESDVPPEKTLVRDGKSGILGSKVPEPRSMYKKIYPILNKTKSQESPQIATSSSSEANLQSPTRVIEITTQDVPASFPVKSKLQRTLQRSNAKESTTSENKDATTLNNAAFKEWQQRMLANQGLVVKGLSDKEISTPKVSSPTILKTSNSFEDNSTNLDKSKPQYILISQGSGANVTKILLPLNMANGNLSSISKTVQQMPIMSQSNGTNKSQQMFLMSNGSNQRMFIVSPQKYQIQDPRIQVPDKKIKLEPQDVATFFPSTNIKTERPNSPASPLNMNVNGLSVNIKSEPE